MNKQTVSTRLYRKSPVALLASVVIAAGCAGQDEDRGIDKSDAGQILGGVAGAAAGSQIGSGSGQTAAMIAGALIGSMAGERIGARMEEDDRRQAGLALENSRTGETVAWENPDTGNAFEMTPVETYERDGRPCRQFEFEVETVRGSDTQERTACRNANGTWEVIG
ncbi:MAG: RT0821/Lpp0805 family surface protein [Woeseia sp.]